MKTVLGPGWNMQRRDGHMWLCVGTLEEGQPPLQPASWESGWQQQGPDGAERQLLTASLWTGGEFESQPYRSYRTSQSWTWLLALMHCCHPGCPLWCDSASQELFFWHGMNKHCESLQNFYIFLLKQEVLCCACLRQSLVATCDLSPLRCLALVSQLYFVLEILDALSLNYQMMQDSQELGVGGGAVVSSVPLTYL